jgi:hypothetical protein
MRRLQAIACNGGPCARPSRSEYAPETYKNAVHDRTHTGSPCTRLTVHLAVDGQCNAHAHIWLPVHEVGRPILRGCTCCSRHQDGCSGRAGQAACWLGFLTTGSTSQVGASVSSDVKPCSAEPSSPAVQRCDMCGWRCPDATAHWLTA